MTNKYTVTTDDTQALTNKDLTGSGNTFPTLNQNTTGNAATATELASPAAINGVNFDGSAAIQTEWFITLTSAYTLISQTAAQQLFNSTANGAITLPVGTYFFECLFSLTSLSSTSGSYGFALGGTAVLASQMWEALATKGSTLGGGGGPTQVWNTAAATALMAGNANTTGAARIAGKIRVSTAGTLIPEVSLTQAAAAIVGADSFFRIWQVSTSATATNAGNWS